MGKHCEVVLHDVSTIENSIVAIKNGQVSGRKVGDSITDLALKILKERSYVERDFLINYYGKTRGGEILRSSTYFIKDDNGNIIGLLCINIDTSKIRESLDILNGFIGGMLGKSDDKPEFEIQSSNEPIEILQTSIEDLTKTIIERMLTEVNIPPSRMSPEEKMEVVKGLHLQGVFLIKGAVLEVARYLETSEATIYRYLNKVQESVR